MYTFRRLNNTVTAFKSIDYESLHEACCIYSWYGNGNSSDFNKMLGYYSGAYTSEESLYESLYEIAIDICKHTKRFDPENTGDIELVMNCLEDKVVKTVFKVEDVYK